MNRGLILEPIPAMSLLKGASLEVRNPERDWEQFLPDFERQSKLGLDTMNCVQVSLLNVLETIASSYGRKLEMSDRFLYWASGCTARGNTYSNAIAGLMKHGCCNEDLWAWLVAMSREEYGKEPPDDIKAEAKKLLDEWDFGGVVYVPSTVDDFKDALTRSPLWFCNSVHSMQMYRVDDRLRVFDSYGTDGKGSFGLDYVQHVEAAYNVIFTPKKATMPPFKENTMYQLVEGVGGFLLFAKGRMYRDEAAKILASWTVRNGKEGMFKEGPVGTLRLKDLDGVALFNLKDEPVTL